MPPPSLQIYLRPRVTLNFDITPKVNRFMPLFSGPITPIGINIGSFQNMIFTTLVTDERTD